VTDQKQLIVFNLGNEEFGVEIKEIREIIKGFHEKALAEFNKVLKIDPNFNLVRENLRLIEEKRGRGKSFTPEPLTF